MPCADCLKLLHAQWTRGRNWAEPKQSAQAETLAVEHPIQAGKGKQLQDEAAIEPSPTSLASGWEVDTVRPDKKTGRMSRIEMELKALREVGFCL